MSTEPTSTGPVPSGAGPVGTPTLLAGRYELGSLIGRGGMADVYLAHDRRLNRTVAVKMLRPEHVSDPTFLARFRKEAHSAASLNHPSIVSVHDSGEEQVPGAGGGTTTVPFIVMEHVEGRTLGQVLDERRVLPVREALAVTTGVLRALERSHAAGIVHRDIKPGNVMLTPEGTVKVMDFGIARVVADVGTVTQTVTGTPQYLSPEHARGEQVDARSDLYSTGCLLFELVTGRTPFLADSGYAMAVKHITEPAPAPSSVNPDIPPVLDQIIGQTLAKDRGARYQTAAQLRADLEAVATGTVPSLAPLAADGSPAGAPATEAIVMQRTAPMPPPQPLAPPAPAPPHPAVMNPAAAGVPTHAAALTPSVAQPQGVAAQPHEAAAPGVGAATGRLGPGAPVSPPAGPPPWVVAPTATVPAATGRSGGRRWWFAAAAVVALALVGTGVWWFGFHSTGGGGQPEASVGPYDTRFDADKASYTRADLEASVIDVDTSSAVTVFDTRGTVAVQSLDGTITALPQTTQVVGVTLAADSSFKSGSFGLTDPAQKELAGLSVKIPYGATVDVDGYTDSVNGEDINLPLSEGWAQAVADRLAEFRPDLVLTVTGHGSDKPVAKDTYDDGTDNPSGQAKNRRVEISYEE